MVGEGAAPLSSAAESRFTRGNGNVRSLDSG
jgi:hypothetical protein